MSDPRTPEELDAELDALIVLEPASPVPVTPRRDVDEILRAYQDAKRRLEELSQQAATSGPALALERHVAEERVRALKYDLAAAVRPRDDDPAPYG